MRILYSGSPTSQLTNLSRLLQTVGPRVDLIDVGGSPIGAGTLDNSDCRGLVVDATSMSTVSGAATRVREFLADCGETAVLLFASDTSDETSRFLHAVTDGAVDHIRSSSGELAHFTHPGVPAARELAGSCYPRISESTLQIIGKGINDVLKIGDEPVFAVVGGRPGPAVYVWSTLNVFDVRKPLTSELEFERATEEYVPGIVFVRTAAGRSAWHNPDPAACLIIDDPLLKPRYGHIDFRHLLDSARTHAYKVALAFIPWNHWRTKRRNAELFKSYSDVFSVCVHGNDHTSGEFETGQYSELRRRASQAIERMDEHRSRTGLYYEPVMVCPQERYSVEGLRAIAAGGRYLAVANSRLIPNVPEAVRQVSGADLLQPAMDAWSSCALLKRHYPDDGMEKIALTLFLGRPVILSEHHGYFSTGTDRIEEMVRKLESLRPDLTWKNLGDIVRTLRWHRRAGENTWQVRFFTDEYLLDPSTEGKVKYELERRTDNASTITSISAQGLEHAFKQEGRLIRFEVRTSEPVAVQVSRELPQIEHVPAAGISHRANVAIRRGLSELRDLASTGRDRAKNFVRPLRRKKNSSDPR